MSSSVDQAWLEKKARECGPEIWKLYKEKSLAWLLRPYFTATPSSPHLDRHKKIEE